VQSEINLAEFQFGISLKHSTIQVLFKYFLGHKLTWLSVSEAFWDTWLTRHF